MKTRLSLTLPCVLLAVLLLSAVPAYAGPFISYRVVELDLGSFGGGGDSAAMGINSNGQVTGVVRSARVATEEGQRECRANVVDSSGAASIIAPVSGLGGGAHGVR